MATFARENGGAGDTAEMQQFIAVFVRRQYVSAMKQRQQPYMPQKMARRKSI